MNQKGFAIIIFLIVGVVVASGGIVGGSLYLKNNHPALIEKAEIPGKNDNVETNNEQFNESSKVKADEKDSQEPKDTTKLFSIPSDQERVWSLKFSKDHKHFAYIVQTNQDHFKSEYYVVWDGKKGKSYRNIVMDLIFSPDGQQLAYVAGDSKGTKYHVVHNDKESPEYASAGGIIFSPDSKKIAYKASTGKGSQVIINGVPEPKTYSSIPEKLVFSPDSNKIAYQVIKQEFDQELNPQQRKTFVVVNGEEMKNYTNIFGISFSPDNKLIFNAASVGKVGSFLVIDGVEREPDYGSTPVFSPDGKQMAYKALTGVDKDKKTFIVINNKKSELYKEAYIIGFSPDSKHFAYSAFKDDGSYIVVLDDREIEGAYFPYFESNGYAFSPDSNHFAFVSAKEGGFFINVGGKQQGSYLSYPTNLIFSQDSKTLSYIIPPQPGKPMTNGYFVVVGINEGEKYDLIQNLTFSNDNKNVIYNAKSKSDLLIVVDKI